MSINSSIVRWKKLNCSSQVAIAYKCSHLTCESADEKAAFSFVVKRLKLREETGVQRSLTERLVRKDRRRMMELREETGVQRSLTERLVSSRLQWTDT